METVIDPTRHKAEIEAASGGLAIESIAGLAVMVLAILALVGVLPALLTTVSGIVFGAAMLVAGIAIAGAWTRLTAVAARTRGETIEAEGGAGVEMLVGLAAIALGILALLGISPAVLVPALIITGGAGLLLSAGTPQRLSDFRAMILGTSLETRRMIHEAVKGSSVAQALGGISAVVLGILALVAAHPQPGQGFGNLAEVGMLVLGLSVALAGGLLSGRLGNMLRAA
jgi:hypothetical protein